MGSGVLQIHGFCLFLTVWAWAKHITSSSSPGKWCYYLVPWITVKTKLNNARKTLGTVSRVLKTNKQTNRRTRQPNLVVFIVTVIILYFATNLHLFMLLEWGISLEYASPKHHLSKTSLGAQWLFFCLLVRSESLGQSVNWAGAIWNPQWSDSLMVTWDPNGLS